MSQATDVPAYIVGEEPLWRSIAGQAVRRPAAPAVVDGDGEVSYAELVARVGVVAAELAAAGVRRGDLVALRMRRGRGAIVAMLACRRLGAGYVPVDPAYPAARQELILEDARPRAIVTDQGIETAGFLPATFRGASAGDPHVDVPHVDVPHVDVPHSHVDASGMRIDAATAGNGGVHDDPGYVIYTSGSTGRPKGVLVPGRALAAFCVAAVERYELTGTDRVLQFASLGFDASVEEIFPSLTCGAAVVLRDDDMISRPDLFLDRCAALGITVLDLPTAYWHELAVAVARGEAAVPATVRLTIIGGEAAQPEAVRHWPRGGATRLVNTYGPTETTVVATTADLTGWDGGPVPIGRPLSGVTCRILDADGHEAQTGELLIGGAQVAAGYLHRDDLTAERFTADGEYRTGDRVRRTPDGALEFLGRLDDQIKIRGFRVEPGEIEAVLRGVAGIVDAVVVAADADGHLRLVGHVITNQDQDLSTVRPELAHLLPSHLVPAVLVRHDRFPLTPQGKVDRRALAATHVPVAAASDGLTPAQTTVAEIWTRLIGATDVHPDDDFTALGGDSLDAVRLISELRHRHGVTLTLGELYADPSLHTIAAKIDDAADRGAGRGAVGDDGAADRAGSVAGEGGVAEHGAGGRAAAEESGWAGSRATAEARNRAIVRGPGESGVTGDDAVMAGLPEGVELPLSPMQRDFWIAEQVCAGLPAHTLGIRYRFDRAADEKTLVTALSALVRKHPLLRARFPDNGTEPHMVIDPEGTIGLTVGEPVKGKFDLAAGPLARAYLTPDRTELVLVVHHLIFDGWSAAVVGDDLAALYRGATQAVAPGQADATGQAATAGPGDAPTPADATAPAGRTATAGAVIPVAGTAPDIAARDAAARADETLRDYWRQRFADADLDLELPADRPRPAARSFTSARISRPLDPALLDQLRALGREQRASLFMVMLAGLQAVLSRYTGRTDVTVLSPVAGRTGPHLESAVGPLLNILPLRGDLSGAPTFAQLVARVRDGLLADLDHRALALPDLLDAMARPQKGNRNRISPVMLTVHNTPAPAEPGIAYAGELAPAATMVDLAVGLDFPVDGPVLSIDYATELFHAPRVGALLDHLLTLLGAAVADPGAQITRLPMLTGAERHRILHEWNAFEAPLPDAATLPELFERHATATPDAPALTFRGETLSYGQLNARANRIARRLRAEGVRPGDQVAICLDRGLDLFAAMWGVLKAGGAYVPLDPAYPRDRLDYMLSDSGAAVLVDAAYLDVLPAEDTDLPGLATEDDPAYVIYTSGSTGKAKGVVVTHGNLVHAAGMWQRAYRLRSEWTYQQAASFSFDMFVGETLRAHTTGGRLVVVPRETLLDPAELYALMRAERVECTELVPAVLRGLLGHADRTGEGLPWVKLLIGGGEKWHVHEYELARRLVGPAGSVVNAYGVTEVTVDNVWFDGSAAHLPADAPLPIGRPFPNNRVYVLDAHREPVPAGVAGEMYLGGLGVAPGYHERPELTADRFLPDPFVPGRKMYRTGDSARFHLDGTVDFLGRLDDQVKVNGYRIELGEVEAALGALPGVVSCAVAVHDTRLIGYVVTGGDVDETAIRDAMQAGLPVHMIPARVLTLDALPLTPNGKLDRKRLPAPPDTPAAASGPAPSTPREREVAAVWSEVLGVPEIGVDDSFFALGGDSFAVLKVVRRLSPQPTLLDFYQHATVRRLAAFLGAGVEKTRTMLHRLTASDAGPDGVTVVAVPFSGGSAIAYQPLADALPDGWALRAVELPGHDYARPDEPLLTASVIADKVVAEMRAIRGPILLYGHCLGVATTVEIARRAEAEGLPLTGVALGAGFPTARLPGRFFDWFYRLVPTDRFTSDREYLAYLRGRGGFTDLDDADQQAFVLRNVRHDARDAEEYFTGAYRDAAERLSVPVLAVVGARDRVTEHYQERHREWEHFTDGGVSLAVLPKAGHFFVKSHAEPLAAALTSFAAGPEPVEPVREAEGPPPSLGRFAIVAIGQFLSMVGSGLSSLVLSIWVFQRTGSVTDFAVVNAIGLLPGIVAGPVAGAVADRFDRRRVMLTSDAVAGLAMAALAVLVFTGGDLRLWQIYLVVSVTSIAGAFQRPAYLAAVAQLVPKRFLGHANGISQLGVAVGTVFAPLLGAGLIASIGVPGVLLLDVGTFTAGVLTLLLVRFPDLMFHRREETFTTEIRNGWRYVTRRPGMRAALRFFVVDHAFYTLGFAVITPMLLIEHSPATLGAALGAGGLGGLAAAVTMGLWGGTLRRTHGLLLFMGLASVSMTVVGIGAGPAWVIAGMFLLTFGEVMAEGHWIAIVQRKVGFELQGRVLSIFITLMMLTMPIGYLVVGPPAERFVRPLLADGGALAGSVGAVIGTGPGRGLALLVILSGVLQLAWAVRGWFTPRLRRIEDELPDALPPAEIGSRDELQRQADAALTHSPS
ncbi:non-ribosomal peptide synthetase/MFS transporter [Catenuloplanes japonicus]|uniref:non-ribosomal peptide synthetase/MFS transporter n=1 Tax=Catenuloplanes japonicus TaxID=33876 RepID=UPI00055032C4|nr:non-ribosomal peptide synthetase/MFS transporter [Catenuloplanes japonicus]